MNSDALTNLPDFEETLRRLVRVSPHAEPRKVYLVTDDVNEVTYRIHSSRELNPAELRSALLAAFSSIGDDIRVKMVWDFDLDNLDSGASETQEVTTEKLKRR